MTTPRIVQHLGFDADFYHPKGRDLALSERVVDAYENAKERARVFLDVATSGAIDAPEVLKQYGRQGLRERLEEHEKDSPGGGMVTLPIVARVAQSSDYTGTAARPDLTELEFSAPQVDRHFKHHQGLEHFINVGFGLIVHRPLILFENSRHRGQGRPRFIGIFHHRRRAVTMHRCVIPRGHRKSIDEPAW